MELTKEQAAELSRLNVEAGQKIRRAERERDEAQHAAQMQKIFAEAARETGQAQLERRVDVERQLREALEENERLHGEIRKLEKEVRRERGPLRILRKLNDWWEDEAEDGLRVWLTFLMGVAFALALAGIGWAISTITWTPPVLPIA